MDKPIENKNVVNVMLKKSKIHCTYEIEFKKYIIKTHIYLFFSHNRKTGWPKDLVMEMLVTLICSSKWNPETNSNFIAKELQCL